MPLTFCFDKRLEKSVKRVHERLIDVYKTECATYSDMSDAWRQSERGRDVDLWLSEVYAAVCALQEALDQPR
jgi:hypothetical protein